MYKIFQSELLKVVNEDNSFILTGNGETVKLVSSDCSDAKLIWNTKDNFNHNYIKYKENTNLTGLEINFKIKEKENIIEYNNSDDIQYLIINKEDNKYNIPIGFLGKEENFVLERVEVNNTNVVKLPYSYLKWNSLNVYMNKEQENNVVIEGKDFSIDYVKGEITLINDNVFPSSFTLSISGQYHSNIIYNINFDRLYTGVHPNSSSKVNPYGINSFSLPVNVLNENTVASLELSEINIISGEILKTPSKLKKHNIKLSENYLDIINYNLDYILNSNIFLGYNNNIIINLKNGEYSNLLENGDIDLYNVLSNKFKSFVTEIFNIANKNNKLVTFLIENTNNFFQKEFYYKNINNDVSNNLNILNPIVSNYYKNMIQEINDLNNLDVELEIILDKFEIPVVNNDLYIFDEYILSLFKNNFIGREYIQNSINLNKNYISDDEKSILSWLSENTLNSLLYIKDNLDNVSITVKDDILNSNNIDNLLSDYYLNINNYFKKIYVTKDNWDHNFEHDKIIKRNSDNINYNYKDLGLIINCDKYLNDEFILQEKMEIVKNSIYDFFAEGFDNVILNSGSAIRKSNFLLYKPFVSVDFNNIELNFEIALCRANKKLLSYLPYSKIIEVNRNLDDVDSIKIEIPKYIQDRFTHNKVINPCFFDIREERLILVNDSEYFVIKQVEYVEEETIIKKVTAYSLEHKLNKINITIESDVLQLHSDDLNNLDGVLNLLEKETGWKTAFIEESAKFENTNTGMNVKFRNFDSVNTDWYSFLTQDICKSFNCIIQFNTFNKTINVYDADKIGDYKGLYLTKDNYMKQFEKVGDTDELVTRLSCFGAEEIGIEGVIPSGKQYIENYSYFLEIGDMSKELELALEKYEEISLNLFDEWNENNTVLQQNYSSLFLKEQSIKSLEEIIKELEKLRDSYLIQDDKENADKIDTQIKEKTTELNNYKNDVDNINKQNLIMEKRVNEINFLLDKSNTKDENGEKLFNDEILDELNEFIYYDTFVDTTLTEPTDILESGKKELSTRCRPVIEYKVDIVNFISRLLNNNRKNLFSDMFLGDLIMLRDEDSQKDIFLYFTGYTYNNEDKTFDIVLSTKKSKVSNTKTIATILSKAIKTEKYLNSKKYLIKNNG